MAISATATPSLNIAYTLANSEGIATTSETSSVGYTELLFSNGSGTGEITIGNVITGTIASGETIYFDFKELPKAVWDSNIYLDFTSRDGLPTTPYVNPERGIKGILLTNSWNTNVFNSGVDYLDTWSGIVTPNGTGLSSLFHNSIPQLPNLNLHATGEGDGISGGFTDIFNGGSGNIAIGPLGTWAYSQTVGIPAVYDDASIAYRHVLSLTTENWPNISGSGGLTSGTSGDPVYYAIWNDYTDHGVDANGDPAINPWSGNVPTMSYELVVVGVTG